MGPSGSGKSTLLNLLGALDRPTSGEIYFEGQIAWPRGKTSTAFAPRRSGSSSSRSICCRLSRRSRTSRSPCSRGLAAAASESARRRSCCRWSACLIGPDIFPRSSPSANGSESPSPGRWPTIPCCCLADEPTGNLDSAAGCGVLDLFDRLHRERGLTLLVITHGAEVAARAERTLWIRDGRLDGRKRRRCPAPVFHTQVVPSRCVA